jgi:hypothetical protein
MLGAEWPPSCAPTANRTVDLWLSPTLAQRCKRQAVIPASSMPRLVHARLTQLPSSISGPLLNFGLNFLEAELTEYMGPLLYISNHAGPSPKHALNDRFHADETAHTWGLCRATSALNRVILWLVDVSPTPDRSPAVHQCPAFWLRGGSRPANKEYCSKC